MAARTYEIRLNGLIPTDELVDALRDVEVGQHELRTVLSGHFVDQAALHRFLNVLRSFDLEVVEVRRVPSADQEGPG